MLDASLAGDPERITQTVNAVIDTDPSALAGMMCTWVDIFRAVMFGSDDLPDDAFPPLPPHGNEPARWAVTFAEARMREDADALLRLWEDACSGGPGSVRFAERVASLLSLVTFMLRAMGGDVPGEAYAALVDDRRCAAQWN